ncbi:MAG: hypothetical protein IKU29_01930 [Parabacteroides sp.]|nr:hypothetical protein [Parabacteroides sp.]
MKLQKITNAAEKLTAVKCYCESNAITSKDLETASMIDADFRNVWEYFKEIFSGTKTETPMAEQPANISEIITNTIEDVCSNLTEALNNHTSVKVEEASEIESSPAEDTPDTYGDEEYFQTSYPDIKVSKSGKVLGLVNGNWVNIDPKLSKGYMVVRVKNQSHQLARLMIETFIGPYVRNRQIPVYKDGNRQNCSIENLKLETPGDKSHPSIADIDRACSLIYEYVRSHTSYTLHNILTYLSEHNSIGSTAFKSICKGTYTNISEKYFTIVSGKFILNNNVVQKETPKSTETNTDKPIKISDEFAFTRDSEKVREWIRQRLENNDRKFSPEERVTIVLSYINDGAKSPEEIRKKMYADFGEIFIPISFIMSVLGKKICPELCNKIF